MARPVSSTTIHVRQHGRQCVSARLWEDPLAACYAAAHSGSANAQESLGVVIPCDLQKEWKAGDEAWKAGR